MVTPDLLAFVRSSLPEAPARVLEIGAGRGELAAALASAGYDVTAIDPAAEPDSHVRRESLLDATGTFHAAVAVVALHHVDPLEESVAHLATLMAPGAVLVVDEIDIDRYDERAVRWWLGQRQALGLSSPEQDPLGIIEQLRHHIHPSDRMRDALQPHFDLGHPIRGPYLHRWELRPGLHHAELELIAEGLIPAVGWRQVATRRHDRVREAR